MLSVDIDRSFGHFSMGLNSDARDKNDGRGRGWKEKKRQLGTNE